MSRAVRRIRSALAHAFAVPALTGLMLYALWLVAFTPDDEEPRQ